ncbi:MAG: hypothetical protein ACJAUP_003284 [Cellvibrionaceae bacterium]
MKRLEGDFLIQYPTDFNGPEMVEIGKNHKMSKMIELSQEWLTKEACANPNVTADNAHSIAFSQVS